MNKTIVFGVVVIEPIINDEGTLAMLTVANNYVNGRKTSKTNFIRSYIYNKSLIRIVKENLHVGSKIITEGHLQNSNYRIGEKNIYMLNNVLDYIMFISLTDKKNNEPEDDILNFNEFLESVPDLKEELNNIDFGF